MDKIRIRKLIGSLAKREALETGDLDGATTSS